MKDFFKKNRGKKGFVMMEVLAITVVILIIFTTVFTMFMPTEGEYEQRIDYNHVSAQYAAFYMRKIYIDEEKIILKKYEPACIFCGNTEGTINFNGRLICKSCIDKMHEIVEK